MLITEGDNKVASFLQRIRDVIFNPKVRRTLTITLIAYLVYKFKKFRDWRQKMAETYPMPDAGSLVTGHMSWLIKYGLFTEQMASEMHRAGGETIAFFLGPTIMNLSTLNPDIASELYQKCPDRPNETYVFLWYLGKENLMFARGARIKQMRLRYNRMISSEKQLEKVNRCSLRAFSKKANEWLKKREVDLHAEIGPEIYDIMGQVMFDSAWLDKEEGREIYRVHKYLIKDVARWMLWPSWFPPLFHPSYVQYLYNVNRWRSLINNQIENHAKALKANPAKYENDDSAVTMLLQEKDANGQPFFDRQTAISTFCGFLNAAYDTTHAAVYWMFWHLSKNPEAQSQLVREIEEKLGSTEKPTAADIRSLEYLHAFFMESMRNRVVVPTNMRVNDEEDVTVGGYTLPKGTNMNFPMSVTYHMEQYFGKDPYEFRPERFMGDSPEAEKARRSWAPFGKHARMCIGFLFAQIELKAILVATLRKVKVELEDPSDDGAVFFEAGVNQPLNKCRFIFTPREHSELKVGENLRWWKQPVSPATPKSAQQQRSY